MINLQYILIKEGNCFVAYAPSLDLSSCGKTKSKAKKMLDEAIDLFLEESVESGQLESILKELGWQKRRLRWEPPKVVSQGFKMVAV
jgi:predicted RNase H-like HicB family nuclease